MPVAVDDALVSRFRTYASRLICFYDRQLAWFCKHDYANTNLSVSALRHEDAILHSALHAAFGAQLVPEDIETRAKPGQLDLRLVIEKMTIDKTYPNSKSFSSAENDIVWMNDEVAKSWTAYDSVSTRSDDYKRKNDNSDDEDEDDGGCHHCGRSSPVGQHVRACEPRV